MNKEKGSCRCNYCTLFDSHYLSRGLAMYESLLRHSNNFHLYIFAFDDDTYQTLRRLNLEKTTIISLQQFEDEQLLAVKPTRTRGEYCWTCTSSTIFYVLKHFAVSSCTYLDADLFFFADPLVLIKEMEENSVLITEHRYTDRYERSGKHGTYCVQFITFRNDRFGMGVLRWWRDACLDWCYARSEDGKFGDQKYLDDWPEKFPGVHVLQNLGGGVAPWNVQQYMFFDKEGSLYGKERKSGREFKLIFYHFHSLKFLKHKKLDLGRHEISREVRERIYKPYLIEILNINKKLYTYPIKFDPHGTSREKAKERMIRLLIGTDHNICRFTDIVKNGPSD